MKTIIISLALLGGILNSDAQDGAIPHHAADSTYDIQLSVQPYKNQWIYLAYYYGSIKALADSAYLNTEGRGVLKGKSALPQGIYIVASPSKSILFEMLVGADQHFSVQVDTTNIDGTLRFVGSPDNDLFLKYMAYMAPVAQEIDGLSKGTDSAAPELKKIKQDRIRQLNAEILNYRSGVVTSAPESILATLFLSMKEPEYPQDLLNPKTAADTLARYRYGKDHYWDDVDFMDGRLVRTPVFEPKLRQYLESWVVPEPDSLIYEFNWMIALGRNDPEMYKFLIGYYIDHYMYPKLMGQDKVFLHVYNNYVASTPPKVDWLNERQLKAIRERALMLIGNQLGSAAYDMQLPDSAGKIKSLYSLEAPFTVVAFWDTHCGKCKEDIPKIDTLYRNSWKQQGVKIYAVMVNESSVSEWPAFIRKNAAGWTHVHQPEAMRKTEEQQGKANFRQLYDMRSTPTLFLLDKDKNIVAKNISLPDLERVLAQKLAALPSPFKNK